MQSREKNSPIYQAATLSGWGLYPSSPARVVTPYSCEQLADLTRICGEGLLARGRGRSYGDAALSRNRFVARFDMLDHIEEFDPSAGVITCEAGVTLEEIIETVLPHGWFLPVTPGTRFPTLGGCFACDVHGKNHHRAGSISNHVEWIDLLTADGETVRCGPDNNPDLFRATAGGMGLTGMIIRLGMRLEKVGSAYIEEQAIRTGDLRETMEKLTRYDREYPYSVAWIDCITDRNRLGRGLVYLGRFLDAGELPPELRRNPYSIQPSFQFTIPCKPPFSLVRHSTMRAFNRLEYSRHRPGRNRRLLSCTGYFYPLDRVRRWNYLYGKEGFLQYQFVVPFAAGERVIPGILETMRERGHPAGLAVLKRMGGGNGMLSFPIAGWTLALDIPVRRGLLNLLDRLDRVVADAGGRVYLAKDGRMKPGAVREMYSEFSRWLKIKRKYDPANLFRSDLGDRLRLYTEV